VKVVILAGGLGTRLSEETSVRPKPMVEIGDRPMLWHLMKIYAAHGLTDFVICLGYKGYMVKEYFANYFLHTSDVTFDLATNAITVHERSAEPWRVTLVDTGVDTQTGGRIKRISRYIDGTFCLTYGDGLADVDISASIAFHNQQEALATMTAVQPPARFGAVTLDGTRVSAFLEKPSSHAGWINGGFFVLEPGIFDYIDGDATYWEHEPLQRLAAANQLRAWQHTGYWQPMDTLREKTLLQQAWETGRAPWKVWS
jgi:glucose-1-phosphate cytidylyltransferase